MTGKLILYYVALMFFTTWACGALIRASNDLCRSAVRDYRDPNRSDGDGDRQP